MLIHNLVATGSAIVSGSSIITGNLTVLGSISGSAGNAISASYALVATTSSYAANSDLLDNRDSTTFANTGSNSFVGQQNINGAVAITGSLTTTGTITAQTINVQQVTSSIVYSSGSNIFGNSLSNTQSMTGSLQVTGSTHYLLGNVGIGITIPVQSLHVNGTGLFTGTSLTGNTAAGVYIFDQQIISLNGGNSRPLSIQGETLTFFSGTSYAERMRITSGGIVGIGTASPASGYKLEVADAIPAIFIATSDATSPTYGGVAFRRNTKLNGNGNGIAFQALNSSDVAAEYGYFGSIIESNTASSENGALVFIPTSSGVRSERMRITSGGNVLIGTTTDAGYKLDVNAGGGSVRFNGTTGHRLYLYNAGNNPGANGIYIDSDIYPAIIFNNRVAYPGTAKIVYNTYATGYGAASLNGSFIMQGPNALQFSSGGDNVRLTIASTGEATFSNNIQLGTTAGTLRIGTNAGDFATFNYSGGGTSVRNDWASTSAFLDLLANSVGFRVLGTGNATLTGTLTQGVSDERFKKNIELIPNALEKINLIHGYTFEYDLENEDLTYIPKLGRDIGVLAQEIEKAIPEAVSLAPIDRNEDDESKSGKNYLTVNYEKIIPLLIQSIKEQQIQIQELSAKITQLENK
jgi:hypothetical protein